MKAITTRYLPATSFKGARVKAYIEGGMKATAQWDSGLNQEENHRRIARILCDRLEWNYDLATGSTKDGYVHVLIPEELDDEEGDV